jgi:hypothetical protein
MSIHSRRQRHKHVIAGGSGDGQQVLVVVASVVEQEVAGVLQKRQRGRGGTGGNAGGGVERVAEGKYGMYCHHCVKGLFAAYVQCEPTLCHQCHEKWFEIRVQGRGIDCRAKGVGSSAWGFGSTV